MTTYEDVQSERRERDESIKLGYEEGYKLGYEEGYSEGHRKGHIKGIYRGMMIGFLGGVLGLAAILQISSCSSTRQSKLNISETQKPTTQTQRWLV